MEPVYWGRRIRAFRKLKGYTQESLAREIGVSVSVLGEIERGTREPESDLMGIITNVLNVTIEELVPTKE